MERRDFVKAGAVLGAGAVMPKFSFGQVKTSNALKIGLIGCGGRGQGAAINALQANPNVIITAVADLYKDRAEGAVESLKGRIKDKDKEAAKQKADRIQVPANQVFYGWDNVEKILATDVDIIIEATPPVFRPSHARAIIDAGKHAFLEKPAGVDATQMHEMMEVAKKADEKGLNIVCGTQRHYQETYWEGFKRLHDGAIGEIVGAQCYWNMGDYVGRAQLERLPKEVQELPYDDATYQIRDWFAFIWASGDHIVEQHVHNIDVIMWGFDYKRLPVEVGGMGGRATDLPVGKYGDRFSHFAIDFDMGDGLRLESYCRQEPGTVGTVGERFTGTKGILEFFGGGAKLTDRSGKVLWNLNSSSWDPYVKEHEVLIDAVANGKKVNDLHNLIISNTVGIAGRESAFSGKRFKYDWIMAKSKQNLLPKDLKSLSKLPMAAVPVPGKYALI